MEVNDINMLLQLVGSGQWATILMGSSIFNHPDLRAIKITGDGMTRLATITWPTDTYCKKSARLMAELLVAYGEDYHIQGN